MQTSTYDPCLLLTNGNKDDFGLVGMQTDDTLIVGTSAFLATEEEKIQKAKIRCKPKTMLSETTPLNFNSTKLTLSNNSSIYLKSKGQGTRIELINPKSTDHAQRYLKQRARGAYLASICQPEAAFDLSVAAQAQNPDNDDCAKLNKRPDWQLKNLDRGLQYVPIHLATAKLVIFIDGSFANNRDLSSQIGYIITLVNKEGSMTEWKLHGNMLHWSSTKCK